MTLEDSDLAPWMAGEERTLFPKFSSPPKSLFELEAHYRLGYEAIASLAFCLDISGNGC